MKPLPFLVFFLSAVLAGAQDFGFSQPETEGPVSDVTPSGPSLEFSGSLDAGTRTALDTEELEASPLATQSEAQLRLKVQNEGTDLVLALRLSPEILSQSPGRILDEALLTTYLGEIVEVQAGLGKITWGKGDDLHVLDVINPQDYSDFINTALEDRKIPQALVKVNLRTGDTGKLELVYLPFFEPDSIPFQGTWAPAQFVTLKTQFETAFYAQAYQAAYAVTLGGLIQAAVTEALPGFSGDVQAAQDYVNANLLTNLQAQAAQIAQVQAQSQVQDLIANLLVAPDTKTLKWSQGGLRYTDSFDGLDWGVQYWTGFLRTPVFNADPLEIQAQGNHLVLDYNRFHQAGLDAAFVLGDLNFRMEGALNITEDLDGQDPLVRNPFAAWTIGADWSSGDLMINMGALGRWTWKYKEIGTGSYDVEAGEDWMQANLGGQIQYKFWNGRISAKTTGSFNLRDYDYMVGPEVEVTPVDDLVFTLGGRYFGGEDDTQMGQYNKNSFVELKVGYKF